MEWDGNERRSASAWHVGREIPIAFIAAILLQTAGGVWWAASLSAKIDAAIATIGEFRAERYTKSDADKDRALFLQLIAAQQQRDSEHERRLGVLEGIHK